MDVLSRIAEALRANGIAEISGYGKLMYFDSGADLIRFAKLEGRKGLSGPIISGDIGLVPKADVADLKNGSKVQRVSTLTASPIMNFPDLVKVSSLKDGVEDRDFINKLSTYMDKLPVNLDEVNEILGSGFFQLDILTRIIKLSHLLRSDR